MQGICRVKCLKMKSEFCLEYLCDKITLRGENVAGNRLKSLHNILRTRTTKACTQNSQFHKGINQFNKLPDNLRNEADMVTFKNNLQSEKIC